MVLFQPGHQSEIQDTWPKNMHHFLLLSNPQRVPPFHPNQLEGIAQRNPGYWPHMPQGMKQNGEVKSASGVQREIIPEWVYNKRI